MTSIDTQHTDMIHDAQMDYFGKRVATCSSDRLIKIFNVSEDSQTLVAELKGHEGPVWQVAWAHPNFGSILCSCSFDTKVIIWKEENGNWTIWHEYSAHDRSVNAVAWAPPEYGLSLACASSDGSISVLTYTDNGGWTQRNKFKAHNIGVNSISWAPVTQGSGSNISPPRFASAGCDNLVKIWVRDQNDWKEEDVLQGHQQWVRDVAWAPNIGLPFLTLASCSQDGEVKIWTKEARGGWTSSGLAIPEQERDVVWRISWSITGNILAVSSGDNKVTLWKESLEREGEWKCITRMDETGKLVYSESDVADASS